MPIVRRSRRFARLVIACIAVVMAAGCAEKPPEDGVIVGSKNFTENILLGQMLVIALQEQDIPVVDRTDLGGTAANREALLSGNIDVYPEYNGTGWTVHLGNDDPFVDSKELFQGVSAQDLRDNAIRWVGLSPFNNTYGFASSAKVTGENNWQPFTFQAMAVYLRANPRALVCMELEFADRPDGLILWEEHTGFVIPDTQRRIVESAEVYTLTGEGVCAFGEVFTTDGRVDGFGLTLVEDPGVMIVYNASFTFNDGALAAVDPRVPGIAEQILSGLDNRQMLRLNFEVDLNDRTHADVAREYLVSIGLAAA